MSESTAAPEHLDFEAALTELERIVQALETGRLPLETALQRYQQGVALVRRCRQVLDEAEQRLLAIENGTLVPLDPPAER
ncbi:MAG: exodeoxyribonuclease VII small subunit [Tepidiphilus sp.]|jgi:exodeoxyribonuclease VII small subunit|uniref:Exodeoxyribonuclease 7 small subunit n=1 Tax=Tepidiphilus thermophilus TaxID=876478 RepID=A0A0K6IVY4_9PROT|nr:exodeoxyribonuclease VII small subunit [Tepidiphilus thermophilus]MBP6998535.1 exodeoxyribonuclease VII small subunit [Tepidiphilus sp.]MDK2796497.1 exodeoxyribonuclease small subunit [Tepidiphilus sp.]CUB07204.1 Exodeoxyribonuclease VII small subunit [Tepidiphilus thermophilus]